MVNPTVQYVLAFFFQNFWHWLALLMVVGAASGTVKVMNGKMS